MKTHPNPITPRELHFMESCRKVIQGHSGKLNAAEIARLGAAAPAPGYYLDFGYALRRLRMMNTGKYIPRRGTAAARWQELRNRVNDLCRRHGITDSDALMRVLAEGNASSFFLTPSSALRLYRHISARTRRCRIKPTPAL